MTTIEPPHGFADLTSQTEDLERQQVAAERAAWEQDMVLARQRRDAEDRARTVRVDDSGTMVPPSAPPAVIDPEGVAYELDADGEPQRDGQGEPIPVGDYDRDEKGLVVLDGDGNPVPPWKYDTVELGGRIIQARKPNPVALQAFSMAVSKYTKVRTQNDMIALFVRNHISERSYNELLVAMMDPDDSFTMDDFGELMKKIATLGTARPTGPSRA